MTSNIPTLLKSAPIIDAVIELRVNASVSLSDALPGALLSLLSDSKNIERLPIAGIPKQVRHADPNLAYQPLVKLDLGEYNILIGDGSIALVSPLPYPGGEEFKAKAIEIFKKILDMPFINTAYRLSMKYTDFIECDALDKSLEYLKFDAAIGNDQIASFNGLNLQYSTTKNNITNLVRIVTPANVTQERDGITKQGLVIEVDSVHQIGDTSPGDISNQLASLLNNLHSTHKIKFFSLLSDYALDELGAEYE